MISFIYAKDWEEAREKFFEELEDKDELIEILKELEYKSYLSIEFGRPHFYERGGCEDSVDETLGEFEVTFEDIVEEIGCKDLVYSLLDEDESSLVNEDESNLSEVTDKITKENFIEMVSRILKEVESPSATWIQFIRPRLAKIFNMTEQDIENKFMDIWFNTYSIG